MTETRAARVHRLLQEEDAGIGVGSAGSAFAPTGGSPSGMYTAPVGSVSNLGPIPEAPVGFIGRRRKECERCGGTMIGNICRGCR